MKNRIHRSTAAVVLAFAVSYAPSLRAAPLVAQAEGLTPPRVIRSVKAEYPPEAVASGREADVVVLATVSVTGDVTAVDVVEHGGDPFDDAALVAARQWKFTPAQRRGKPIESQVRIPFHFRHGLEPVPSVPPAPGQPPSTAGQPPGQPSQPGAPNAPGTNPPGAKPPNAPAANAPTQPGTSPPSANPANQPGANAPAQPPANPPAPPTPPPPLQVVPEAERSYESNVASRIKAPPSRGASDYHVDVGALSLVPRANATEFLKLAPGILLTNEGGEGHAEQVFLRGFDARESQDIEVTLDGEPVNEVGNLHGNGYADTHFIIPELVQSLRVVEGPVDPRQGNFAVAGSTDWHLGLRDRGVTAKFSAGNYGTYRMLLTYGPQHMSDATFAAVELYQTQGFGQNRDGRRGSAMAQYEFAVGDTRFRLFGQAYIASFHSAGVIRDDDYRTYVATGGKQGICFYCTYDPLQGEDGQRHSVGIDISHKTGHLVTDNMIYGVVRPLRLRENFTGFLLDTQTPLQPPHGQRGDLIDMNSFIGTVGLKGTAKLSGMILHQLQELEIGYFARGDFGSATQQRIEAATGHPYQTDVNQDFRLGDIGLYGDLDIKPVRWLALRGGIRGDLFTYDVHDNCAVHTIEHPNPNEPLFGQSCYSEENFGNYREPDQRASTVSAAYMPRGALLVGPFAGVSVTAAAGQGVRSVDPLYITQDTKTPFASATDYEAGVTFARRFAESIDLSAASVFFDTRVDQELVFSQSAGRNTLCGGTTRLGSANTLRLTGPFYDLGANLTYVRATFDQTSTCSDLMMTTQAGLLVPYVPDLVFRADSALFATLPWRWARWWGKPVFASIAAGVTYVGPRPLPYGARSDTIFTVDGSATIRWWLFETGIQALNLFNAQYRLGEYNYASDFHSQAFPTLVPVRQFAAGAPLTFMWSLAVHYGDRR